MTIHALLIDDDPDTRAIIALALDLHSRFAVTAVSRFEAASLLGRGTARVEVILLNMKPSDSGAGALVASVRQWSGASAPILLLTDKVADADRAIGIRGVIAKPFDPIALPDRVAGMIAPAPVAHSLAASAR